MSKKKDKSKSSKPTKAELEAREVELKAALKKAAKKTAKTPKVDEVDEIDEVDEGLSYGDKVTAEFRATLADKSASKKDRKAAAAFLETVDNPNPVLVPDVAPGDEPAEGGLPTPEPVEESTAAIKARVKAKQAARESLPNPDDVDRTDESAVKAYNDGLVDSGQRHLAFLTSIIEREAAAKQETEVIETETGREFAAGTPSDKPVTEADVAPEVDEFAPAAPVVEFDGIGRYKIYNPATGKGRGYTRATTYIDCLEDKGTLEKWKMRTLLEGASINAVEVGKGGEGEYYLSLVAAAMHTRDHGLKKLAKRDRKGDLATGERAIAEAALIGDFKRALDTIAHDALELGGVHEKAQKGTDLHALCEVYDLEGLGPINEKLKSGEITPADHADVVSYAELLASLDIKILEVEQMVVRDDVFVAGRLDRLALVRFPGAQRAVRVILDIKTGRVDYSAGKIGMQLLTYALGKGYDPADPTARRDLKANRTKALLIHLPAGKAEAAAYEVDLTLAARGLKLAGEVRKWRNEGKKVYDLKAPLVMLEAGTIPPSAA